MLTIRQRQLVELETFFGRHETPCWNAIQNLKIKFDMLRQACDAKNKTTQQRTRILRRRKCRLGLAFQKLPYTVFCKKLSHKVYKIQLMQKFQPFIFYG